MYGRERNLFWLCNGAVSDKILQNFDLRLPLSTSQRFQNNLALAP